MVSTTERALMDTPVPDETLLTTEQGKMYNLYILRPDGTREVLEDDGIFDNWFDHCIKPSAFVALANKHGLTYTEATLRFIHREYLENYLDTSSILDVCIEDMKVEVTPKANGQIAVYCYRLGIDQQFSSITALNDFLLSRGGLGYHVVTPYSSGLTEEYKVTETTNLKDITKSWAKKVDNSRISIVLVKRPYSGELEFVAELEVSLRDVDLLKLVDTYYKEHYVLNTGIVDLILSDLVSEENHNRYILGGSYVTQIERASTLKNKWGITE